MGAGQSARKVTLDNPDPQDLNNVIKVSDRVVQRLKNTSGKPAADPGAYQFCDNDEADEKGGKKGSKAPQFGTPVSAPRFYPVRDNLRTYGLPYLTNRDVQEYVQEEIDKINKYWEKRMQVMKEGHEKMTDKMVQEYARAQVEIEKLLPREIPENAQVPCESYRDKVASCFKTNSKQTLLCLKEVQDFKACLDEARKAFNEEGEDWHSFPDECKEAIIADDLRKPLANKKKKKEKDSPKEQKDQKEQ